MPSPIVLRIATGPSGREDNGKYVLDQERSEFDPATDKQVVVVFQWQGEPGPHRLNVKWTGPDGSIVAPAPTNYLARDRQFGAYWSLALSATAATGTWTVEATVDGQPAGRQSFQIVASNASAGSVSGPVKRLLSTGELFARASGTFVLLDRATKEGQHLDAAGAVALGGGRLLTAVAAMDGADAVTAVFPDGTRHPITSMVAMNRRQDWIVLAGGPTGDISQPIAPDGAVQIGDPLFTIAPGAATSRVLTDGITSGRGGSSATGPRIIVSLEGNGGAPGGGVFDQFGQLVGVIGGSLVSGTSNLSDLIFFRSELRGTPIVPVSLVRTVPGTEPVPLEAARSRGDLLPSVHIGQDVVSGGFAKALNKTQTVTPSDQRNEFSATEQGFLAFVSWSAQTHLKGQITLKMYDEANRLALETKPSKINIWAGSRMISSWKLPIPAQPGVYRADVSIDGTIYWRGFVRISE